MATQILVVDDDPLVNSALESILERLGHQPIICASGADALCAIENHPDSLRIIILDAHLGDMSGFEFMQILNKKMRENKFAIIVISAHSQERLQQKFPDWQIQFYLKKPFNQEATFQVLKRAFDFEEIAERHLHSGIDMTKQV